MNTKSYAHHVSDNAARSPTAEFQDDVGVDLRAWLGALRRGKFIIAAITLIGTIVAYFVIDGMTPLYTSTTMVLIQGQAPQVVDFEAVVEGVALDPPALGSQVEILRSRTMAARVVDELSLMDDPEFNATLRPEETSLVDTIDPRTWLPQSWLQVVGLVAEPGSVETETPEEKATRIRMSVIGSYLGHVEVEALNYTYVLAINFTSEDPDKSARIANTAADLYIVEQLEAKFEATSNANAWLNERLEDLRREVIAADNALASYEVQNNLRAERESLIEQQLNDANGQLMQARTDRVEAEARLNQMRNLVATSGPSSVGAVLESSMVQSIRSREAEARRELAELSTRYGDLHPEIINIKAEIEDLQRTINEEVDKILQNLANDVDIAMAREASVRQAVENLRDQFNVEQEAAVGRLELERDAEAARLLYDVMLARYKEVGEQEEIQQADARIISPAVATLNPSWPKKKLFLAASFVMSFVIGIGVVVVAVMMSAGFRTMEEAERALDLRALAEVPVMTGMFRSDPEKSIISNHMSGFAEAVRSLSTSLILSDTDDPPKLVAIASSLSAEGKTSVAIALARLMAMGTRKVLLIDGDMRKPRIHRALAMPRSPGLSDVITHDVPLLDAVHLEESTGLHLLSAGTEVPDPQDLLQSKLVKETLKLLGEVYDIVIIDTPAILPVSDGLLLTHLADKTIFLVRWEDTPRNVATRALGKLQSSGAEVAGVVLSRVNRRKQASYGVRTDAYYYGRY